MKSLLANLFSLSLILVLGGWPSDATAQTACVNGQEDEILCRLRDMSTRIADLEKNQWAFTSTWCWEVTPVSLGINVGSVFDGAVTAEGGAGVDFYGNGGGAKVEGALGLHVQAAFTPSTAIGGTFCLELPEIAIENPPMPSSAAGKRGPASVNPLTLQDLLDQSAAVQGSLEQVIGDVAALLVDPTNAPLAATNILNLVDIPSSLSDMIQTMEDLGDGLVAAVPLPGSIRDKIADPASILQAAQTPDELCRVILRLPNVEAWRKIRADCAGGLPIPNPEEHVALARELYEHREGTIWLAKEYKDKWDTFLSSPDMGGEALATILDYSKNASERGDEIVGHVESCAGGQGGGLCQQLSNLDDRITKVIDHVAPCPPAAERDFSVPRGHLCGLTADFSDLTTLVHGDLITLARDNNTLLGDPNLGGGDLGEVLEKVTSIRALQFDMMGESSSELRLRLNNLTNIQVPRVHVIAERADNTVQAIRNLQVDMMGDSFSELRLRLNNLTNIQVPRVHAIVEQLSGPSGGLSSVESARIKETNDLVVRIYNNNAGFSQPRQDVNSVIRNALSDFGCCGVANEDRDDIFAPKTLGVSDGEYGNDEFHRRMNNDVTSEIGVGSADAFLELMIPEDYFLDTAYPNPSQSQVHVRFGLPEAGSVRLRIFDAAGREVTSGPNRSMLAGTHTLSLDVSGLASGTYFYRVEAGAWVSSKTITIMR